MKADNGIPALHDSGSGKMNQEIENGAKHAADAIAVAGLPLALLSRVTLSDVYLTLSIIWLLYRFWDSRGFKRGRTRLSRWLKIKLGY